MNQVAWLNPGRWLLYGALIAGVWLGMQRLDKSRQQIGYDRAEAEYNVKAVQASEDAREKEHGLLTKVTKVSNDYQTEKRKRAAAERATSDSLRDFNLALNSNTAPNDPAATGRVNGTGGLERELLGECSNHLAALALTADRLESKVVGLQSYARDVCVSK